MPAKFAAPDVTADGSKRAAVDLRALKTLWINTGTLCNIECENCYILSSPKNDALVYITHEEICAYLDEVEAEGFPTREIGVTGGEPFMNPDILAIMEEVLNRGFRLLVLTNAMMPMQRGKIAPGLLALHQKYGGQMTLRISADHFKPEIHEQERGAGSWQSMINGLKWLSEHGFQIDVAGRTRGMEGRGESEDELRDGFGQLFKEIGVKIDAFNPKELVLFPEMDESAEVPEITEECWDILGVSPDDMMCSSSRMVVKRKGADKPAVLACTLLAYDEAFELGESLKEAHQSVPLNHPHCAKFCVLGGGACSVSS